MFTADQRVRLRDEEVAAKVIDGEVIIINLANGTYYSMDGSGAFVWELLQQQPTVGRIVDLLVARYDVSREDAHTDLQQLMGRLLSELLIDLSGEQQSGEDPAPRLDPRIPYECPSLNIYRDMGDLLALDPPTPGLDTPWKDQA